MIQRKIAVLLISLLCSIAVAEASRVNAEGNHIKPSEKYRRATSLITNVIESHHYKKVSLDNKLSRSIWNRYLDSLDPNKNIFLKSDIRRYSAHKLKFDDYIRNKDLRIPYEIFDKFKQRLRERVTYAIKLLDKKFDYTLNEEFEFNRENKPWPATLVEANNMWRKRVKHDILNLQIAGKKNKDIKTTLKKRYQRLLRTFDQWKNEDIYQTFINAYTQSVEPHTSYLSPRSSENFKINMSLSLEGIGAALRTENEYTVILKIIKGGPADLSGELHPTDKIVGVAQGEKEYEDVIGSRLSDVVDLIRGPKGSVVRLQILPKGKSDAAIKEVKLTRDKIKLEEQAAKSSIIDIKINKRNYHLGVLDVPAFYMDFDARARGESDYRSTTRDVTRLINDLQKKGIDGIIVDLRGNGGGSLVEATALSGLFIKSGPIVQVKSSDGDIKINSDPSPNMMTYQGPMAVLVDRYSASASEIFAGAIQDYKRGLIIGEPTFGKGTVQTLVDLNRWVSEKMGDVGQLKITIAQFFRINGESTQFRGVVPDIIYPTFHDDHKAGERGLENALPWAKIRKANFKTNSLLEASLKHSKSEYNRRLKNDPLFKIIAEETQRFAMEQKKTSVSLLQSKRMKELNDQEKIQKENDRRFRKALGMNPDPAKKPENGEEEVEPVTQYLLKEAAHILADYIDHSRKNAIVQHKKLTVNK